jgi:broad specificity phosphatase PhoE
MPTILLVRHGQASYGAADYDVLSDIGRRQAELLAAQHLRIGLRPDLVVCGDLHRQRDTAQALAAAADVELMVDRRWNEYDGDDILEHHSATEARLENGDGPTGPTVSSHEFQKLLDGALTDWIDAGNATAAQESWPAFDTRVHGALQAVVQNLAPGETAVVCSSGGAIGALCAALVGLPPAGMVTFNRVSVNTGVTRLVNGRRGTTLVSFNEQGHLDGQDAAVRTYR